MWILKAKSPPLGNGSRDGEQAEGYATRRREEGKREREREREGGREGGREKRVDPLAQ